jgi:dual specificity MAP kinase phosphatase
MLTGFSPFSYELLKWEEFLGENRRKRQQQDRDADNDGDDTTSSNDSVALLPPRRELEWASVAREIAAMNKPYARQ